MENVIAPHIEMRPSEIHGDVAWIVGTRIRVMDVYIWHELWKWSSAAIVVQFPHLTPADVHAAMAFYWDHAEEIQQQLERERELDEEGRKTHPSKLPEAMKRLGLNADSIPS